MHAIPPPFEPGPEDQTGPGSCDPGPDDASPSFVVRYGQMRHLGEFKGLSGREHPRGQKVVVRTERGIEMGEVLCEAGERSSRFLEGAARGPILRVAQDEDIQAEARLEALRAQGYEVARSMVARHRLAMDLVEVEPILGGERLVFYYLAEGRVDFRELVKDLARAFRTRIEMRQIGIRDEAKLLADYGDCGQPVCCNTHLSQMPPVTMRMAKLQKSTLDPAKISGRCGRLKCCLRYEYETYQEGARELPPPNARVETTRGHGKVLAQEILARRVLVEFEDKRRLLLPHEEILRIEPRRRADRTAEGDD